MLWDKSGSIACAGDPQGGGRHDSSCCYSPTVSVVLAIEELCRAFGRPSGLRQRDPDEMAFFTPSETRTKESSIYASIWVLNPRAQ